MCDIGDAAVRDAILKGAAADTHDVVAGLAAERTDQRAKGSIGEPVHAAIGPCTGQYVAAGVGDKFGRVIH